MHLAVRIAALLRQLVPGFWLGQQLGDGALRQSEHELGEESLADVVHGEELADASRNGQRVEGLTRVAFHGGAQHLLEAGFQRITLGQERCQAFRQGHERGQRFFGRIGSGSCESRINAAARDEFLLQSRQMRIFPTGPARKRRTRQRMTRR